MRFANQEPVYYRTGDIAAAQAARKICYLGRKNRMNKKRGYRDELSEMEARSTATGIVDAIVVAS
jgi:non-ribosomal peptide synthetase component F